MQGELTTELVVAHNLEIQILPANLIGRMWAKMGWGARETWSSKNNFEAALLIPGKCHHSNLVNYWQMSFLTNISFYVFVLTTWPVITGIIWQFQEIEWFPDNSGLKKKVTQQKYLHKRKTFYTLFWDSDWHYKDENLSFFSISVQKCPTQAQTLQICKVSPLQKIMVYRASLQIH